MEIEYNVGVSGQTILFADCALSKFRRFQQRRIWHKEAGGSLFVREGEGRLEVIASGPTSTDKRSRFGFLPDRKKTQEQVSKMYRDGFHYVGTWHTHPQHIPKPSEMDWKSIASLFQNSEHSLNAMLLVVVGTAKFPEGLSVSLCDGFAPSTPMVCSVA